MEDWTEFVELSDLKRELTLQTYVREQLDEYRDGGNEGCDEMESTLAAVRDELEGHAMPGDVWWEWIQGTEPQMQCGGLAVVRDGKIVWATDMWVS